MNDETPERAPVLTHGLIHQLRQRGVVRVAASYAIIAWLVLQIADVTFEPLGVPRWIMVTLIVTAALGFPVALLLAWFYEITPQGLATDTAPATAARPHARGVRRYSDAIIIAVLLVVVGVLLVRGRTWDVHPPALAVLPFVNTSGMPDQEYFSDGVAEELLDRLSRVPGLLVAARGSSFTIRDPNADPRDVATKLGVTSVLIGRIGRSGGRLKLSAELVDGRTGFRLWSATFERSVEDVFAIQDEVATQVARTLLPDADLPNATQRAPTVSVDAHDLYLLGRSYQVKRGSDDLGKSVELFEQAIALDPNYALAHTGLANSLLLLAFDSDMRDDYRRRAEVAIYRALAIDPELSEAHGAHANLLRDRGRPGAEEEYRRAIELNPNNAIALHDYHIFLANIEGRHEEGVSLLERAAEIDPLHLNAWVNLTAAYLSMGDKDRYAATVDRTLARFRDAPEPLGRLAFSLLVYGDPERSARAYHRAVELSGPGHPRFPGLGFGRLHCMLEDLATCENALRYVAAGKRIPALDALMASYDLDLAGLKKQYARIPALAQAHPNLCGHQNPEADRHAVQGFWLAVEGQYVGAASHLRQAGPLPSRNEERALGFCNRFNGLMPAVVLTYRTLGDTAMADELAKRYRQELRQESTRAPGDQRFLVMLAALDALAGHKTEAVSKLRQALDAAPYPTMFIPAMPWFRELEGTPGYAALVQERDRRRRAILARIATLHLP